MLFCFVFFCCSLITQRFGDGFMRIDATLPLTNLCDVLLQFEAGCNLGILIRDIMMKGSKMGEASYISLSGAGGVEPEGSERTLKSHQLC